MKSFFILNKKEGETPLRALENFRVKHKAYQGVKMTYAGRLDPMASGLLLVLAGEETKNKDKYLKLNKTYEFEVLFGFATDTYDVLGKVIATQKKNNLSTQELRQAITRNLKHFRGKIIQQYPIYSSKTVAGKQLWQYGRAGEEIETPGKEVVVRRLEFLSLRKISSRKLLADIKKRIRKVEGDFRQKEILKIWNQKLRGNYANFNLAKFKAEVSSGTYVRAIAQELGQKIGVPALAYRIKRTSIGKFGKMPKSLRPRK